jgi:hypothetical protein
MSAHCAQIADDGNQDFFVVSSFTGTAGELNIDTYGRCQRRRAIADLAIRITGDPITEWDIML